ncbi:NAD(P)/FAD-dependent oxidoreductase [Flexivirga alba]|uniref:NAD(P)/FAD-dependent oxidoreductase n=1 Tax=Flexivirga alba TaxID=702742 RepID=A0ABW2AKE4_9MICO
MSDAQQDRPQRIVVVGSGFAGFEAARGLSRRLRRASVSAEIMLVSPDDYMLYTPLLPDVAGGLLDPKYVAVPLSKTLPDVVLRPGRVAAVDLDAHTLQLRDQIAGTSEMHWDKLVLTPGSVTRLFDVPGLADNAHGLKTVAEALYLREHFLRELELADHDPDEERRKARRTVVVVGASYAGTELVTQLRKDHASHGTARHTARPGRRPERGREPRRRRPDQLQAPRPRPGGRPRAGFCSREPTGDPARRSPCQVRHPRLPPLGAAPRAESVGDGGGLSARHRRHATSVVARAGRLGGSELPQQRGRL